ncbi:MAG: hypothetical protein KAH10_05360 [Flavobacteriales bacterium]|nr:hypothetical protein [Flavobacteriales bacterium]
MDYISNHSNWALITILLILIALIFAIVGLFSKKEFGIMARKFSLYAMIATHIQVILGLISYMISEKSQHAMQNMGAAMKDSTLRLYAVEHPLVMIIAAVLLTVGYSKAKSAKNSSVKFKNIVIFYSIGLLLILSRIPWSDWGQH